MKAHGREHWARVERNARQLAVVTEGADAEVAVWFARLHDAMRENDFDDPGHGPRAASFARSLHEGCPHLAEFSAGQLDLLCYAIEHHDRGAIALDPTVGVCWDADRLELPRVGVEVDPELLSTEAGKDLAQWLAEDS